MIEKDQALSPSLKLFYKKFKNMWTNMTSSLSATKKAENKKNDLQLGRKKKSSKLFPENNNFLQVPLKKAPTTKERTPRIGSIKNHFKSFSNLKKKRDHIFFQSNKNLLNPKMMLIRNDSLISSQMPSVKNLDDVKVNNEKEKQIGTWQFFSTLLIKHKFFQNFMNIVTMLSLFLFVINTPITDPDSKESIICGSIEIFFIACYLFEFIMTINSIHLKSFCSFYFKNFYNLINLVNIVVSIGSLVENKYQSRTFETIKIVRVFRLISTGNIFFQHINLIISSLLNSLHNIFKLLIFFIIFIYIFSLFAMKFLKGIMFQCLFADLDSNFQVNDKFDCMDFGGDWIKRDLHYDNILMSFFTLFCVSSSEAWTVLM